MSKTEVVGGAVGVFLVAVLIGGGYKLATSWSKKSSVPLKIGITEGKIRSSLPIEVSPGLDWFDIQFTAEKRIKLFYRIKGYTAEEFKKQKAYLELSHRTGARVCQSDARKLLTMGGTFEITYFGKNDSLISTISVGKALCKVITRKKRNRSI